MKLSGCKFGMIISVVGYVECGKMVMWGCVLMHGVVVAQNQLLRRTNLRTGLYLQHGDYVVDSQSFKLLT